MNIPEDPDQARLLFRVLQEIEHKLGDVPATETAFNSEYLTGGWVVFQTTYRIRVKYDDYDQLQVEFFAADPRRMRYRPNEPPILFLERVWPVVDDAGAVEVVEKIAEHLRALPEYPDEWHP